MEEQIYENILPEANVVDEAWQDEDKIHFESRQDVTELVRECRDQYNEGGERPHWGEGRLVARIPTVLWDHLRQQGITADPQAFRAWMNDPDNRAWRTLHGVL